MKNKKINLVLFIIFIIAVLIYALYTAKDLIYGPRLVLDIPKGVLEVSTQVIEITGSAVNAKKLKINNKEIFTNPNGQFAEKMLLSVGVNTFNFIAVDRFGHTNSKTLQVVYTPPEDTDVLQLKNNNIKK